jgi:hypothetical protein
VASTQAGRGGQATSAGDWERVPNEDEGAPQKKIEWGETQKKINCAQVMSDVPNATIPPNDAGGRIHLFGARQIARCQAVAHLGIFEPAAWRGVTPVVQVLYTARLLRAELGDGARFPASGHRVDRPPAAITRGTHSAPCLFWKENTPTMVYRYPRRHNAAPDVRVWPHNSNWMTVVHA